MADAIRVLAAPLALALVLTGLAPAAAHAQYRPDQPPVLEPPPAPDPDAGLKAGLARFAKWSAERNPVLVIYWNRSLTDDTTTERTAKTTTVDEARSNTTSSGEKTANQFGEADKRTEDKVDKRIIDTEARRVVTTGGRYNGIDTTAFRLMESTYFGVFERAGAKLLDRDLMIRSLSTRVKREDREDIQYLESLALQQGADYLIEVLADADKESPTGFVFTVKIRDLKSQTFVGQFLTSARPPNGPSHVVAVPGGFQHVSESRTTPDRVAVELAAQTMARLGGR